MPRPGATPEKNRSLDVVRLVTVIASAVISIFRALKAKKSGQKDSDQKDSEGE